MNAQKGQCEGLKTNQHSDTVEQHYQAILALLKKSPESLFIAGSKKLDAKGKSLYCLLISDVTSVNLQSD